MGQRKEDGLARPLDSRSHRVAGVQGFPDSIHDTVVLLKKSKIFLQVILHYTAPIIRTRMCVGFVSGLY
jgi:hypothetical protein